MNGQERRQAILGRLLDHTDAFTTARLCQVCRDVTGVTGAGIMLITGDVAHGSACTTDTVSALVEQLQYDLGEGPCLDAYHQDHPVLEPDLADPDTPRWMAFTVTAVDAGARAVFGFPLRIGAVRLGALNLYNDRPGNLTDDQYMDALVMSDLAAHALLLLQAHAPPDTMAAELEASANLQSVVHQATGMVAVQLDVPVSQALIRLRAHAFGNDRPLTDVARDIVARRLRFDVESGENDHTPRPRDGGPR
jgi:GAF domain-containing protein